MTPRRRRSTIPSLHEGHYQGGRSAVCVGGPVSYFKPVATTALACQSSSSMEAGRAYVEAVLARYLWVPATPTRISRHDRRLARTLHGRAIPLLVVEAALLTGAARRIFRKPTAAPLPPIRTLHYFLPLIDETLECPPDPAFIAYLEQKLLPWAEIKAKRSGLLHSG